MNLIKTRTNNLHLICVVITIITLAYTIIPTLLEAPEMGSTWRKDQKLIPTLQSISKIITENEKIVSSNFDPTVYYFTGREIEVPNNLSSYTSLLNYMDENHLRYIMIIEGQYNVPTRDTSFKNNQMNNLTSYFKEIATFDTESSKL